MELLNNNLLKFTDGTFAKLTKVTAVKAVNSSNSEFKILLVVDSVGITVSYGENRTARDSDLWKLGQMLSAKKTKNS